MSSEKQWKSKSGSILCCRNFINASRTWWLFSNRGSHETQIGNTSLGKSLSTSLCRCWWRNIYLIMWFCLSVIFLLNEELCLPNLECRHTSRREIDSQFFTGIGNIFIKHFKKHFVNWENWTPGFYDSLYTKIFKLLVFGFMFSILILQTFFLALYQTLIKDFFFHDESDRIIYNISTVD